MAGMVVTWLLAGLAASFAVLLVGGSETLYGRAGIGSATLGPAYVVAAALVASTAAFGERQMRWFVALPSVALAGLTLVTVGSRGPLLSAAAGAVAWVLLRRAVRWPVVVALLVMGGAIAAGFRSASGESLGRILLYEDAARSDLWSTGRAVFLDSPILGFGWGDFSTLSWGDYPHNVWLELGVELGLVGLLAFVVVLFAAGRRTWRQRGSWEVRILGAVGMTMLVGQHLSFDLTNRVFWISVTPLLLFAGANVAPRPEQSQRSVSRARTTPNSSS
jgi:O-antigen ligase